MEIRKDEYQVTFDEATATITCSGRFRLRSPDYKPIIQLLNDVTSQAPPTITLDVRQVQFLNSSGINALSKFVIQVRKQNHSQLVVRGSNEYPWQKKSLRNFQRLKRDLVLEIE
jgi:hypothetical protein